MRALDGRLPLLLLSLAASARAQESALTVVPKPVQPNAGALLDQQLEHRLILEIPMPSMLSENTSLVMHDMLIFHAPMLGVNPLLEDDEPREEKQVFTFLPVGRTEDALDLARATDLQLLYREPQPTLANLATGLVMFGANAVIAAHGPAHLRALLNGPVHFGPASFDGGGMGTGLGGFLPYSAKHYSEPTRAIEPEEPPFVALPTHAVPTADDDVFLPPATLIAVPPSPAPAKKAKGKRKHKALSAPAR